MTTNQDQDVLLGRLAVHYKILSKKRASEAIRLWRAMQSGQELGDFLVAESYISPEVLPKLLRAREKYLRRTDAKENAAQPEAKSAAEPEAEPAKDLGESSGEDTRPTGPVGATTVRLTPDMLAAAAAEHKLTTEALPQADSMVAMPISTEPVTAEPPSGEDLLLEIPAPPEEAALDPATLEPFPGEPEAAEEPVASELLAPEPSPLPPLADSPEPATPEPAAPEPAAPEPAAPEPAAPEPAAPEPVAPAEIPSAPAVETAPAAERPDLGYAPGATLEDLLRRARELGASDLHVHSAAPLKIRLHGVLRDASEPIDRDAAQELIYGVLSDAQRAALEEHLQLDFSFSIPGVGRFRANGYFQHWGLDGVFRIVPPDPPTLEQLGLPDTLHSFSEYHQGIVLFTGPAGCGKSSTMAALVRLINESRPEHILTIEDPIEYVHEPVRCVVNQREVGPHTESFARALRAALREDPDIIALGELRDLETIQLALTAAETGHLVLGTLHTASTIPTINRIVGVFPPDQQSQIRNMVSESLRAIVSQRLVPRADGAGRVPVLEILVNNKAVGNLIRENRTFQINSILQTGIAQGMCQLDASLAELVKEGVITKEAALREAIDSRRIA